MKKTKIICTIGPASDQEERLEELIKNGMDIARLNLSHNTQNYHQETIKKIRKIAEKLDKPIAIITDLQGPKHSSVKVPLLTKKDMEDIKFGLKNNVDFIGLSFTTSEKDIINLRKIIKQDAKIIAKIETRAAVQNIDKIIKEADGIMIARGDLGVELPIEDVPLIQKTIIQKCLNQAKPVIVATQMLASMENNPLPTRAEASDIANAVMDQADALMLSEETAIGKYPLKSLKTMVRIITQTENFEDEKFFEKLKLDKLTSIDDSLIFSLNLISQKIKAKLILVISLSGYSGRIISRFRPKIPLFVFTCGKKISRQLNLHWGLFPLMTSDENLCQLPEKIQEETIVSFLKNKILKKNDVILVVGRKDRRHLSSLDWIEIKHI